MSYRRFAALELIAAKFCWQPPLPDRLSLPDLIPSRNGPPAVFHRFLPSYPGRGDRGCGADYSGVSCLRFGPSSGYMQRQATT
jgi:hypothetical protein